MNEDCHPSRSEGSAVGNVVTPLILVGAEMVVQARERFTRLRWGYGHGSFAGLSEPSQFSSRWTVCVCPKCRAETGFEQPDFLKHVGRNFSNLMYPDRQAVERQATSYLRDENAFVDFYCSGCDGVVRAYYRYDPPEEKVHGEGIKLAIVVESTRLAQRPS